jgi:O-antigen/teichoic acid export membrane protein
VSAADERGGAERRVPEEASVGPVELPAEAAGVGGEAEIGASLVESRLDLAPPVGARRRAAARGMVINSGFFVALGTLQLLKAVIVARLLTQDEFGVWSIVFLAFGLVFSLKSVAVGNKYVQQDEADQESAFQKAFTLELASAAVAMALMAALAPALVFAYGEDELLGPALVLALVLPGLALQAPAWIFYRRMDFLRQRLISAVDPIVGFVLTIALAAAGLDYWSLVLGLVGGAWAGGAVALIASPYRLALRFERRTLGEYLTFSWPLLVAVVAGLMIAQLAVYFGDLALGLAGAGAIGLAATFAAYADRIDSVVTQTIYPAICRVVDRGDLLLEVFVKSNRLALMWAVPLGVGLSLFAGDLIEYVIGEQWRDAEILIVTFGLTNAIGHVGFNWVAFYRALGRTKPEAVVTVATLAVFLAVTVPLLLAYDLDGFAAGTAAMTAVAVAGRWYYLKRILPGLALVRYVVRAFVPTAVAAAAILAARVAGEGERTGAIAGAELVAYLAINVVLIAVLERRLIAEALSYLRAPRSAAA